jgi:hypothetical protein
MSSLSSEKRRGRIGVGRVELVPEPRLRFERLRSSLADTACRLLVLGALIAQAADSLMTAVALGRSGYYERNPLFGSTAGSPIASLCVKLGAILAVLSVALLRLPTRRARMAVGLAFALSAIGPLLNTATLFGR